MVKIYLIAPPYEKTMEGFPGGLTALKSYLDLKISPSLTDIIDMGQATSSQIEKEIETVLPKEGKAIIGITVNAATYLSSIELAKKIKEHNPDLMVVLGGPQLHEKTGQAEVVLEKYPFIDYVCTCDGEKTLYELALGKNDMDIPNIAYRDGNTIVSNKGGRLTSEELGEIPFIFISITDKPGKFADGITYVFARGCDHNCSFCAASGQIRAKSIDRIIDDLETILKRVEPNKKGQIMVAFENNYFALDGGQTYELLKRLAEKRGQGGIFGSLAFNFQSRVGSLQSQEVALDDFVGMLYDAGATKAYFGVENFHPKILKAMNKLTKNDIKGGLSYKRYAGQVFRDASAFFKKGMEHGAMFIVGHPVETQDIRDENVKRLNELAELAKSLDGKHKVYMSLYSLYPGTLDSKRIIKKIDLSWKTFFEDYLIWERTPEANEITKFMEENFAHAIGGVPISLLDMEKLKQKEFAIDPEKVESLRKYIARIREIPDLNVHIFG